MEEITRLVVRMARENRSRDYTRIQGALRNVGHEVGRTTVANILQEHGIEPAPDPLDGSLAKKRLLILDRDRRFSKRFRDLIEDSGVEILRLPAHSPNLNAYAERFVRSIKEECLNRTIFFGARSLRRATREFAAHYHEERNGQGIGNRLITPGRPVGGQQNTIRCSERPGGVLRFYHRAAA